MKKIQTCLLTIVATLLLTGCDQLVSYFDAPDDLDIASKKKAGKQEVIHVHKVEFSPDYKTFTVTTRMNSDIGPYSLTDSNNVRVKVKSNNSGIFYSKHSQPRLIGMRNVKYDNIAKKEVKVLALIDLTQSQNVLNRIHDYLVELHAVFNDSNLLVSFIHADSVSLSMNATKYVLDNYLVTDKKGHSLLYRAINQKYDEMLSRQGIWAEAKNKALLIFSDSKVYNNATDKPFDPDHYIYEEYLAQKSNHPAPNMMVSYVNNTTNKSAEQDILVLKHLCEQTKGTMMRSYNGTEFKNCLLKAFHISQDANNFTFENPDRKIYCGNFESLTVDFYSVAADTLITSFNTIINKGDIYNPIIVHGLATPVIVLIGIVHSAVIALIVWLFLQFVVPYIRYKFFCHKYVIPYTGHNMGIGKNLVAESCYLCKEAFEPGDEVVVKCSHTMHKECWDENGYHCTEYSDHCKHGSHYYNRHNLTDRHNAPFFTKWILVAIVASTLAWIMFISRNHHVTSFFVSKFSLWLSGIEPGTPEAAALLSGNAISPLPSFGFSIGLFMTLGIAILSEKLVNVRYRITDYLLRSIVSAVLCYVAFLFINILVVISEIIDYAFLFEWIPWIFTAFIIAVCGTYGTRVRLRNMLILPCVVTIIIFINLWSLFYNYGIIEFRIILLIGMISYGTGLAACIATSAPRSERYFLHVQGAVKEMDIAIFKWFRSSPDRVVTIGKSVDCSLQLSWDFMGDVAPVHAEIRMRHNAPYLRALEEGVIVNNKLMKVGQEMWLYHGMSFTISNTTFTYIEKDLTER